MEEVGVQDTDKSIMCYEPRQQTILRGVYDGYLKLVSSDLYSDGSPRTKNRDY
jgi:hypothetical protein